MLEYLFGVGVRHCMILFGSRADRVRVSEISQRCNSFSLALDVARPQPEDMPKRMTFNDHWDHSLIFSGKTKGDPWENYRKMEVYPLVMSK